MSESEHASATTLVANGEEVRGRGLPAVAAPAGAAAKRILLG